MWGTCCKRGRNIWQNVGPPTPEWSREHVTLNTANLAQKQGTISGVVPVTQINPRATLISLTELMEEGGRMRTVLVAMIMSIISAEPENTTMVKQKQSNRIQEPKRYQRRLTFMCLKSGGRSNMFMVFHGYGQNENLLNGMDPSLKYNGALRECVSVMLFVDDVNVPT